MRRTHPHIGVSSLPCDPNTSHLKSSGIMAGKSHSPLPFSLAWIRAHQFDLTLKRKHRFVMSLAMEQMSSVNLLVGASGMHKANQEN